MLVDQSPAPALPSEDDGPLETKLQSVQLEDVDLKYEALSYVWGEDATIRTEEVICNGEKVLLGRNLVGALIRLRRPDVDRLIWADALCINQSDIEERSTQVQQMARTYSMANKVIIWLGEDIRDEAPECFRLIQETSEFLAGLLRTHAKIEDVPFIQSEVGLINASPDKWDMVDRLMISPWFKRVWTLQEVGLARSADLFYGNACMKWSYLVELLLCIAIRPDLDSYTVRARSGMIWEVHEAIWQAFDNAETWKTEQPYTASLAIQNADPPILVDILNTLRFHEASDARDRVYAFLGHPAALAAVPPDQDLVEVDYNKSILEVYVEFATSYIQSNQAPWTLLSAVDHTEDETALKGLRPSWVPWWNESWRVYWLGYLLMWYRAGGNDPTAFKPRILSTSVMSVPGYLVDQIEWTSQELNDTGLEESQKTDVNLLPQIWGDFAKSTTSRYGNIHDSEIAFSLVLVAGRAADEGPAEDDLQTHCSVYEGSKSDSFRVTSPASEAGPAPVLRDGEEQLQDDARHAMMLKVRTFFSNQRRALHNRRMFRTKTGYYGVCHKSVRVGDVCSVIPGANVPFVLRPVEAISNAIAEQGRDVDVNTAGVDLNQSRYRLVGEAYIQGLMRGELLRSREDRDVRKQGSTLGDHAVDTVAGPELCDIVLV